MLASSRTIVLAGQTTPCYDADFYPFGGERAVTYTYDALYRLSTALTTGTTNYPQWGLSWSYDRYGNRTAQTVTAGSGVPSNSVTVSASTNRISGSPYAYDANGNMTNDGANTLTYDAENHAVTAAGATYTYDGNGLRVKKVSGGTTTVYIFSGSKVLAEYVNGAAPSSPTKEYLYVGGGLLATIAGTTTTYHHSDHLSVRVTTDSSGAKIGEQGHYPYGESWYAANTTTKFQFTSYERDSESGNDFAMARYYANRLGRFNAPDPVSGSAADPQTWNRYAYVGNNPINHTDPSGLLPSLEQVTPEGVVFGGGPIRWMTPDALWNSICSRECQQGQAVYEAMLAATIAEIQAQAAAKKSAADGSVEQKKKDLIKAALAEKNLSECLHIFFGPGTILTNANLPRIDASEDLPGATAGRTDPASVPDSGRATIQIDKGIFTSLTPQDSFLVGTYLHETANALAIQRFTQYTKETRAYAGPRGALPLDHGPYDQVHTWDHDIGNAFEKCIREK